MHFLIQLFLISNPSFFAFAITNPDDDVLYAVIDWRDRNIFDIGPYNSYEFKWPYKWDEEGPYIIKVN